MHLALSMFEKAHSVNGSLSPLFNAAVVFSVLNDIESEYLILIEILRVRSRNPLPLHVIL